MTVDDAPLLVQVSSLGEGELVRALLAWAPPYPDRAAFVRACASGASGSPRCGGTTRT